MCVCVCVCVCVRERERERGGGGGYTLWLNINIRSCTKSTIVVGKIIKEKYKIRQIYGNFKTMTNLENFWK